MKYFHTSRNCILLLFLFGVLYSCKKNNPAPKATFNYTVNAWQASFQSSSSGKNSVVWLFGDGQQGTGDTITHQYANPGDYTVKMIVGKDTATQTITLKERIVQITTSFGVMYMYLYNETPKHRDNYLKLAETGFYDSTTFHRVIPNFVIQGGDPNSKGADQSQDGYGGPGYDIDFEDPSDLTHIYGAVGAASEAAKGPSNGSQFYIVVQNGGAHYLDGNYTVFGYIMKGMDVAQQIVIQPRNANDRPNANIRMSMQVLEETKAEVLANYGFTVPN